MDTNVIIRTVLGVVVSLIVIVSVAVPIISDLGPVDIENDITPSLGDIPFRPVEADESFTITIDPDKISYNGMSIEYDYSPFCIVSDVFVLLLSSSSQVNYKATGFDTETQQYQYIDASSRGEITLNISNGVISTNIFDSSSTFSSTFQYMYLVDPSGGYWCNFGIDTTTVLDSDAVFQFNNKGAVVYVDGECVSSHVIPGDPESSGSYTEPEAALNDLTRDGNLITFSSGSVSGASLSYWIIPMHVGQEPTPTQNLIQIVPVIMMAGLIIAAVAAFITLKSRGGGA